MCRNSVELSFESQSKNILPVCVHDRTLDDVSHHRSPLGRSVSKSSSTRRCFGLPFVRLILVSSLRRLAPNRGHRALHCDPTEAPCLALSVEAMPLI